MNVENEYQQTLMLNNYLGLKQYELAYELAYMLSKNNDISPELKQYTVKIIKKLEKKNLVSDEFLKYVKDEDFALDCYDSSTSECKDGYEFIETKEGKKCCKKLQKRLTSIEENVEKTSQQLISNNIEDRLLEEFQKRFNVAQDAEKRKQMDVFIRNNDIQKHTLKTLNQSDKHEMAHLTSNIEKVLKNGDEKEKNKLLDELGLSSDLFQYLLDFFRTTKNFVMWFINNDWSRYWTYLWIMKCLSYFVCIVLTYPKISAAFTKVAMLEHLFGLKAMGVYLISSWYPIIFAGVVFTALLGMFMNPDPIGIMSSLVSPFQYLFSFVNKITLHYRFLQYFAFFGFFFDIYYTFKALYNAYETAAEKTAGAITGAYCKTKIESFYKDSLSVVKQITIWFFGLICDSVFWVLGYFSGNIAATTLNYMTDFFTLFSKKQEINVKSNNSACNLVMSIVEKAMAWGDNWEHSPDSLQERVRNMHIPFPSTQTKT